MIDKEIIRNQSGYYDETAGKAILNIEREKKMNNKTGEIWKTQATDGTEYSVVILKDHGAIISALRLKDERTGNDDVEVVAGAKMYADCRKVHFLRYSALTGFVRTLSDAELRDIRIKVTDALDLGDAAEIVEKKPAEKVETRGGADSASQRLVEVTAQLEVYQKLYNELLARVV